MIIGNHYPSSEDSHFNPTILPNSLLFTNPITIGKPKSNEG